ncbi:ATP-binding protein [Motilimonas eburnea]|uniref:ATP-binding protein n=1 Tax=Motilimonas eburnea TaxID=1737488 RepID=UPI001E5FE0CC|nr:ATP-binding protein [Motilimonas eburnea]MCE2572004.1 response regulator [Motilimonas eburnea]
MLQKIKNISFRAKLGLAFLLLSITPMAVIAIVFHASFVSNNNKQVADTLYSIALSKENTLEQHLLGLRQQALHFSNTDFVRYAMSRFYGFSYAFNLIADEPKQAADLLLSTYLQAGDFKNLPSKLGMTVGSYAHVHDRFHDGFIDYLTVSDFNDIILINLSGQVVYSTKKDGYFTENLRSGELQSSPLGQAFVALERELGNTIIAETAKPMLFHDYSFDNIKQAVVSYFIMPINNHGRYTGYIAYALPTTPLTKIMASRQGLGLTGETYVINKQGYPISALQTQESQYQILNLHQQQKPLWLDALHHSNRHNSGTLLTQNYQGIATLAAYVNLDLMGHKWVIVAEQANSEIQATSIRFRNLIILIGVISVAIIIAIVYLLSRSLTRPLESLMLATEAVTLGEWDRHLLGRGRRDEIGRLAAQFDVMQDAITDQMKVINDTNQQLEEKVAVINEQNIALRQADKIKDEFLTNTSHELRTPLTGVIGITESVLNGVAGPCSDEQAKQLNLALNGAKRLAHLVDDLLDFHKVKNNRLRVDMSCVSANVTVSGVLALSKHLIGNKPVELNADLPTDEIFVNADPIRFEQVLFNLVNNAIKYTDSGQITVSVVAQGEQVMIAVKDTGMGIAPVNQARIFDPFKQLDGSETRRQGGSGLGLAISQQLISLMKGNLSVESEEGKGSCFRFNLGRCQPLAPMLPQGVNAAYQLALSDGQQMGESNQASEPFNFTKDDELTQVGRRILVVDDEQMNLQVLKNHLSLAGYQIKLMTNGDDALAFLQQQQVDLLILDVMMPKISGFTVAQEVRKTFDNATLPILMLTAKTRVKDIMTGFHVGANDYLMKPFVKDELLARVHNLLELKQAAQFSQENKLLKQEVARRIEAENALQASQVRMTQLLENVEDAIVIINPFNQVVFFNQGAQRLLGYSQAQMIGVDVNQIMAQCELERISRGLTQQTRFELQLDFVSANGDKIRSQAFVSQVNQGKGSAMGDISIVLHQTQGDVMGTQSNLGPSLCLSELEYRQVLVDIMTKALALWQDATGKSKIDLAQQSKIWKVYLDRSSAQTRTLDRYFLLQTLPKIPRWRDVLRTAAFVKQQCAKQAEAERITELEELTLKVKNYFAQK